MTSQLSMEQPDRQPNRPSETPATQAALYALLADETRLGIVLELYDARTSNTEPDGLTFSVLRCRVGVEDSGRFNYHLDQLTGALVRKVEDRYTLTGTGERLVRALDETAPAAEQRATDRET